MTRLLGNWRHQTPNGPFHRIHRTRPNHLSSSYPKYHSMHTMLNMRVFASCREDDTERGTYANDGGASLNSSWIGLAVCQHSKGRPRTIPQQYDLYTREADVILEGIGQDSQPVETQTDPNHSTKLSIRSKQFGTTRNIGLDSRCMYKIASIRSVPQNTYQPQNILDLQCAKRSWSP
jgi:hypothetical protein